MNIKWSLTASCWLAGFLSWKMGNAFLWVIFHFFAGSAYLAYWLIFYTNFIEFIRGVK